MRSQAASVAVRVSAHSEVRPARLILRAEKRNVSNGPHAAGRK